MTYSWTQRKEMGQVIITDLDSGKKTEHATLTCCHCNRVWIPVRGSGTVRGFCVKCMGPTCGAKKCDQHFNFEKKLDMYEKGLLLVLD